MASAQITNNRLN